MTLVRQEIYSAALHQSCYHIFRIDDNPHPDLSLLVVVASNHTNTKAKYAASRLLPLPTSTMTSILQSPLPNVERLLL
jgi:hypothetical protein